MASAPLQTGTLLNNRYNILAVLGQGGMGTVYKAEHVRLHSIVAVKEIHGLSGDEAQQRQELDRCEYEAQFLVKLNHPNLPKVTDAFIENECFYLVMEYIEGVTLDTRLSALGGKPLDVAQSVEWGLQIADVLGYLHTQDPPIIFRDLKPSNVMIPVSGGIKLIDFGIARHFQPGASKDTSLLGSVGYSPPEQFGKGQTDSRSDVYAFGATMHHLLTGRDPALQPFKFPAAKTFNPRVPASLSHLLDVCLALDPNQRPESMHVVAMQLLNVREELAATAAQTVAEPLPASGTINNSKIQAEAALSAGRDRSSAGIPLFGAQAVVTPSVRVTAASKNLPRQASSSALSEARTGTSRLLAAGLLALIAGSAAVAYVAQRPSRTHIATVVTAPLVVENTPPANSGGDQGSPLPVAGIPTVPTIATPTAPGNSDASNGSASPATPPAATNINLQTALLPVTGDVLSIAVSGSIKGQSGTQLKLAVYFFDAKGQPVEMIDASNMQYSNSQKYLCTYKTIVIPSDDLPIQEPLPIPTHFLIGSPQPVPFTYQVMLFQDGKPLPLYKTSNIDLPPAAYGGSSSVSTPPTSNGGNGNSPSKRSALSGGHVGN